MDSVKENVNAVVSEDGSILDSLKDYLPSDILQNEQLKKYGTKGVAFLEQVDVTLPNDGNYDPPVYDGATKLASGFHNIPRGGNTNDIVSLSRFPKDGYDSDTADDYVRGIVVISVVMALIYILWGLFLLLLRLGRLGDCCSCGQRFIAEFRAQGGCCIQRHLCGWLSGRTPQRPTKASIKRDQEIRANGIVQKSMDVITTTSVAAATTAAAVTTTSLSGKKKENSSLKDDGGGGGVEASKDQEEQIVPVNVEEGVTPEDPPTNDDNNKHPPQQSEISDSPSDLVVKPNDDVTNEVEEQESNNDNNKQSTTTKADEDVTGGEKDNGGGGGGDDDDQTANTEIISDEDLATLQQREERHMMAIRISFLVWGFIVIIACIMLSISGFGVAGRLVDSTQASMGRFENYLETIISNCDDFLNRTAQARQAREQFLAKFDRSGSNSSSDDKLCPNFPTGIANIEVNLGQLFDGPLLKLAEVRDSVTNETSVTVVSFLDDSFLGSALDLDFARLKRLVKEKIEQGKGVANGITQDGEDGSIVEVVTNAIPEGLVDQTVETVTGVVQDVLPEAGETVQSLAEAGQGIANQTVQTITEVVQDVIPEVGGAVQSITEAVPTLLNETVETVTEVLDDVIIPEAGEAVQSITEAVPGLLNETLEAVSEVLDDVIPEAGEAVQSVTEAVPGLLNETVETVNEVLDDVIPEAGEAIQSVTEATQGLVNQTVQAVAKEGESRRMQEEEEEEDDEIVAIGGDAASFTVIGDPTAYKNNLSALLATNFSLEVNFIEISERINKKLSSSSFQVLGDKVYTLRNGLQFVLDTLQDASNSMDEYMPFWFAAVGFATVLALFVVFMMVGTILAWMGNPPAIFRNVNDCVILPIFIFVGHLLWIATCTFLCLGIITGDLCFTNPDDQLVQVLNNTLEPRSSIGYNFAFFYLTGCNPVDRPLLFELLLAALLETRNAGADFFNMLTSLGPGPLGQACGNDINLLRSAGVFLSLRVDLSVEILTSVAKGSSCKSINPLITDLMYDILCTDIMKMMGPMFFSLFLVSIGSMVMVTLRVAWHEMKDDLGDEDAEQESGCCRLGCGGQGKKDNEESAMGVAEAAEQPLPKSD